MCSVIDPELVIRQAMNPSKALYFYEPLELLEGPKLNHHQSTLMMVSPNEVTYHKFIKQSPSFLYYPLWKEHELVSVYRHMTTARGVVHPPDFSEADVLSRFKEFVGIFRQIFANERTVQRV
jgi:hypothetical protein